MSLEKPISQNIYDRFPFLRKLISESTYKEHGAVALQGLGGNGIVTIEFGPKEEYHGYLYSVELDERGDIVSRRYAGRLIPPRDPLFPDIRPSEKEARYFIKTLFTPYELRGILVERAPQKHRFDVAGESGSKMPDGKITHHDLWDLAANQGKGIEEIARTVEAQLQREGLLAKK